MTDALKALDRLNLSAYGIDVRDAYEIDCDVKTIRAALTQPKADVEGLIGHYQDKYRLAQPIGGEQAFIYATVRQLITDLAAQGYIGGGEGWQDISTIPDNLMSGVDLWDDREEKRYINCTFDLRAQAWADEKYDFVKIPTHWMPLPAAPKKEGNDE